MKFRPFRAEDAVVLAELRAAHAVDDQFDPLSTMENLPAPEDISKLVDSADSFSVVESEGRLAGYAWRRSWDETNGPRLYLCDWYLSPAHLALDGRVLKALTAEAREAATIEDLLGESVVGTNASDVQTTRRLVIERQHFEHVFSQIEMELTDLSAPAFPLPGELEQRNVTTNDAQALIDLTERVWKDRPYFTMPKVESFQRWVDREDLDLFHVATHEDRIVGFVAGIPSDIRGMIDDVQVDPDFQRQGIARSLINLVVAQLRDRGATVVRLNTEANDPAGARSLYESLGFREFRSYDRFRKPLEA